MAEAAGPADVAARFPKPPFDLHREAFEPPLSRGMAAYCLLQFALLLALGMGFLALAATASLPRLLGCAAYLAFALWALGALLEGRRWAAWPESVRLLAGVLALLAVAAMDDGRLDVRIAVPLAVAMAAAAPLPWWLRIRDARSPPRRLAAG